MHKIYATGPPGAIRAETPVGSDILTRSPGPQEAAPQSAARPGPGHPGHLQRRCQLGRVRFGTTSGAYLQRARDRAACTLRRTPCECAPCRRRVAVRMAETRAPRATSARVTRLGRDAARSCVSLLDRQQVNKTRSMPHGHVRVPTTRFLLAEGCSTVVNAVIGGGPGRGLP